MWDTLKAMLPLADLSVFHGQEELLIKVLSILPLSSGRGEIIYTWTINPVPMPSINNQRRYKKTIILNADVAHFQIEPPQDQYCMYPVIVHIRHAHRSALLYARTLEHSLF